MKRKFEGFFKGMKVYPIYNIKQNVLKFSLPSISYFLPHTIETWNKDLFFLFIPQVRYYTWASCIFHLSPLPLFCAWLVYYECHPELSGLLFFFPFHPLHGFSTIVVCLFFVLFCFLSGERFIAMLSKENRTAHAQKTWTQWFLTLACLRILWKSCLEHKWLGLTSRVWYRRSELGLKNLHF